jgi:hypothetical protein
MKQEHPALGGKERDFQVFFQMERADERGFVGVGACQTRPAFSHGFFMRTIPPRAFPFSKQRGILIV